MRLILLAVRIHFIKCYIIRFAVVGCANITSSSECSGQLNCDWVLANPGVCGRAGTF